MILQLSSEFLSVCPTLSLHVSYWFYRQLWGSRVERTNLRRWLPVTFRRATIKLFIWTTLAQKQKKTLVRPHCIIITLGDGTTGVETSYNVIHTGMQDFTRALLPGITVSAQGFRTFVSRLQLSLRKCPAQAFIRNLWRAMD